MEGEITYFNERVQKTIDKWPIGIRAFYARTTERMIVIGPNLGMPFTRSMGEDLFEIRVRGKEGNCDSSCIHQKNEEDPSQRIRHCTRKIIRGTK